LKTLLASWRNDGIAFPESFEIILCHEAKFPFVLTTHAGILFPRIRGFSYIEKAGGSGPFVRLEIRNKEDLIVWLSGHVKGSKGDVAHLVTFNDTRIELLKNIE
jgi:hypothetical protein